MFASTTEHVDPRKEGSLHVSNVTTVYCVAEVDIYKVIPIAKDLVLKLLIPLGVTLSEFDYDTITIRPEVNGHMEPLTDP